MAHQRARLRSSVHGAIVRRSSYWRACSGLARRRNRLRACLSAPWKGAELQWESKPTRQLSLQPVAAEAGLEVMNGPKPLVQKARSAGQRASRP